MSNDTQCQQSSENIADTDAYARSVLARIVLFADMGMLNPTCDLSIDFAITTARHTGTRGQRQ